MPRTGLSAEEVREKAVDFTLERIRAAGYDKLRLTDVARDIGLSHASLYAHFASKADLIDAVTERWLLETEAHLRAVAERDQAPRDKLVDWLCALYQLKRQRALRDAPVYEAFDFAAAGKREVVTNHLATMQAQLADLVAEAKISAAPATDVARLILAATTGFHHPKVILQDAKTDREADLRAILAALLRGLADPT